jgi:hypothetical protein
MINIRLGKRELERIYGKVLWIVKEFLNSRKLRYNSILVVGSLAKGETSCIKEEKFFVISDIDLFIFTSFSAYFKCMLLRCIDSLKELEKVFLAKGIRFHVNLSVLPLLLYRIGLFRLNTIYYYEMVQIVCNDIERVCRPISKCRSLDINKYDILELAISSFIDYLSVIFNSKSEHKYLNIYVLSKRILTLLYCIELYAGFNPRSFSETPTIAVMNIERLNRFIDKDENELKFLEVLSDIKNVKSCLGVKEKRLVDKNILMQLYEKLLTRFLTNFSLDLHTNNVFDFISNIEKNYRISFRKLLSLILLYAGLYLFNRMFATRENADKIKDELVTLIRYRMRLQDLLKLIALKYAIALLNNKRLTSERNKFAKIGINIVSIWHRYMLA